MLAPLDDNIDTYMHGRGKFYQALPLFSCNIETSGSLGTRLYVICDAIGKALYNKTLTFLIQYGLNSC